MWRPPCVRYSPKETGCPLLRLFSMFPNGWPGRGLLLLRITDGVFVIHQELVQLAGSHYSAAALTLHAPVLIVGALLLSGIWTPIAATILAALEIGTVVFAIGRPEDAILSAAIALSVAMLGPGVWSVDAAIFGRRRLEFPND
jgi:putative oxidoreductase